MDTDGIVAISYAHDDIDYNEKVVSFVNCLREKYGYNVIMDELLKQKETAIDFNEMMCKLISNAEKVIVLLTSRYKEKAVHFSGSV